MHESALMTALQCNMFLVKIFYLKGLCDQVYVAYHWQAQRSERDPDCVTLILSFFLQQFSAAEQVSALLLSQLTCTD